MRSYERPIEPNLMPSDVLKLLLPELYDQAGNGNHRWNSLGENQRNRLTMFAGLVLANARHVENTHPRIAPDQVQTGDVIHVVQEAGGVAVTRTGTAARIERLPGDRFTIRAGQVTSEEGRILFYQMIRVVDQVHVPWADRNEIYLLHRPTPSLDAGTLLKDVTHDGLTYPIGLVVADNRVNLVTEGGQLLRDAAYLSDLTGYTVAEAVAK